MEGVSRSLNKKQKVDIMFKTEPVTTMVGEGETPLVIINDLGSEIYYQKILACKPVFGKKVVILNEAQLIRKLLELVRFELTPFVFGRRADLETETTVILSPGRSAEHVVDCITRNKYHFLSRLKKLYVHAERRWGSDGEVNVSVSNLPDSHFPGFLDLKTKAVLVIDDVVSGGDTMRLAFERNSWRFPRAHWFGATLISRKDRLPGYKKLVSSVSVPAFFGKNPPINSLSTLLLDKEIRARYASRYFKNPDHLESVLEGIGSEVYEYW